MPTDLERDTITIPATPMQESLWWVHQRARNKSVYNITWRLTGDRAIDPDALGVAWQTLVDRHEALRTSVVRPGDDVQMVVHPSVRAQVRRIEVDDPGAVEVDALLRLIAEEVQEQETALDGESLARLTVVRVADRQELLLTVHHLVLDGWGMQLVTDELSTAYAAALAGRSPEFAAEPVPFRVYAAEQNTQEARDRWRASVDHWRTTLEGTVATTVAAANGGEFLPGAPGRVIRYTFSAEACTAIAKLAARTYATPFAIFQGAMHIVLARGGAGADVAIGAVLANRMSPRDQALVGYTANLCISRANVPDTDRVVDVVTRARDNVWAMLTHQAVPYPVMFAVLSESTRRALTDDSPMGLSHLGPIGTGLRLGDVELTLQPSPNRAARADVSISTWEADDRYYAEIEFNTSRYSQETVELLLSDLDEVLVMCGEDPDRVVGTIDVRSRSAPAYVDHAQAGRPTAAQQLPESAGWQRVTALWSELLGEPPADADADFFGSGGNSLVLIRLASELEAATGVEIDVVDWLAEPTPSRLVAQLGGDPAATQAKPAATTLVTLRDGSGPHVHMLHGAGGDPNDFREVAAALPGHWRITASREYEPLASVPAMARRYRDDLDAAGLRPDILCGWSMGGLVAYQMAAEDPKPPAVVLLDSPPPTGYEPGPEEEMFATFAGAFVGSVGGAAGLVPRTVGDPELRTRALAACLAAGGHAVSAGVLGERWRAYARHARMGEAYVGPEHVRVPALVVGADLRDTDMREWAQRLDTSRLLRVDADHYGVLRAGTAAQVAEEIVQFESESVART
ncbi:hypothetical protein GCM10027290_58740 [Micromonospora sonneratiae]|uniref:Condensation domain-containing protein n=1 Tax=Micromonospora sonneratiae TaxID=1184706 RepID=A0ABW3YLY2_9ACTN